MTKNILVFLGGVTLSLLLMSAGEWINQNTTSYGRMVRENKNRNWQEWERLRMQTEETRRKYGGSHSELFWRAVWQDKALINPLIVLIDGLFIGFFASKRAWLLAIISLIPFLFYSLGKPNPYLFGLSLLFSAAYILLGAATAFIVARWVKRPQSF